MKKVSRKRKRIPASGRPAVRLLSAADALKPPPAQLWCVEGLFPRPSLNMLLGASASKKTLLAIDLAVCVALGKEWLRHKVAQGAVLYLDEQSGPLQFWNRLNPAFLAHGVPPGAPFHYSSMSGLSLRDKASVDALIERCHQLHVHFVVFDSFSNFLHGVEFSSSNLLPALSNLRRLAEETNAVVLVVHHTNRQGVLHGSALIPAAFDLLLSIESKPDESSIKLSPLKSRFKAPQEFFARAVFENDPEAGSKIFLKPAKHPSDITYWWQRSPYASDSPEFRILRGLDYNRVRSFYSMQVDNGWMGARKLRNAVQALLDAGLICRVNEGKQGKHAQYSLVKPLEQVWPDSDA